LTSPADGPPLATAKGLVITAAIVLGWGGSLVSLLALNLPHQPWWALVAAVLLRTQLQTGLFIVGHDAMHGLLWPSRPQRNHALGAFALALYAALPYGHCRQQHQRHHLGTASADDPDFPTDHRAGPLRWYGQFMAGYLSLPQMGWLLSRWGLLACAYSTITPSAVLNVLIFCTLPLLLSSFHMFLVGTYLPHRVQRPPGLQSHPASLNLPPWLSMLACFHFGYHREHHDNPGLSWFQLPAVRQRSQPLALT